ncbi:MAG: AAA domain-containing protein [Alicyclobacillaceae bacterium]|nr:AAA domain-containing protein [Alicyclobacillaceae bacterium]
MQDIFELYRDRLIDLSKRNPSLRLLKLTNKNHADMCSMEFAEEGHSIRIAQAVVEQKQEIVLMTALGQSDEELLLNRRLTTLRRELDLIEQETGANTFHVAYGFLEGTLVEDFFLRSPILMYPGHLLKKKIRGVPHWVIDLESENPPFLNPVLDLALNRFLGVNLGEAMKQVGEEVPAYDVWSWVDSIFSAANMKVARGEESLAPFQSLTKSDIIVESVPFRIQPFMIFGKFRQSTSNLLVDYEALLKNPPTDGLLYRLFDKEPIDEQLSEVKTELLNQQKEEEAFFVLNTDASQEAAVVASRGRDGLIVHGPPGTGKSQVIVNLIADRLARGQRVLVVCQKPVALEVVYNRLAAINLNHQVVLVHDVNRDKAVVYGKIGSILQRNIPSGVTPLERISTEMDTLANSLNIIAHSLHVERPFGKTLQYLYGHAKWDQNLIIDVSDLASSMTYDELQKRLLEIRSITVMMQKFDNSKHPWAKRKSFVSFGNQQHMQLEGTTKRLSSAVHQASEIWMQVELPYTPQFLLQNKIALVKLKSAVQRLQRTNLHEHVSMFYAGGGKSFESKEQIGKVKQKHQTISPKLNRMKESTDSVNHLSVLEAKECAKKIADFLGYQQRLTRFVSTSWYGLKKEVQAYCVKFGVQFTSKALQKQLDSIQSFLLFQEMREDLAEVHFFSDVPMTNSIEEWEAWARRKQHALEILDKYVEAQTCFKDWLPDLMTKEDLTRLTDPRFTLTVDRLLQVISLTEQASIDIEDLNPYLDGDALTELYEMIRQGIFDAKRFDDLHQAVRDFDSLQRLDQMKDELDGFNRVLMNRCRERASIESTPSVVDLWTQMIENSFIHAWIDAIEQVEKHVSEVSTGLFEQARSRYGSLLQEKRKLVPEWIDQQLALEVPNVRGQARTTLKHEAGKKRQLKPLRKVLREYTPDVLKLVPCWLCTPEAVSAIFPPENGLFDLVIFDEASQCPVENALPAIYRGKQVVVAGDEKQLPPTNLFRITDDEDDLDDEIEDFARDHHRKAQHLLDWSKPKMADQWLTWHYRSVNDGLINFSNYAFYGKRMQTAPIVGFGKEKPIEFIRVDGKWMGRRNQKEAERIADVVIDILKYDQQHPTLGIITFNADQTELIHDVLDARGQSDPSVQDLIDRARSRKDGDQYVGLFVKNIENVQGDERDIILFSVAYANDQDGKMVSQFGALSKDMGENRLNVAITRARFKIYIVCSFEPSEWTRVETYSRGPRLLKRYLEYAKAVSDGDYRRVNTVLEGVLDATAVQSIENVSIYDSPFEEEVAIGLRNLGYQVQSQIGFSGYRIDLAIVHPDDPQRFILGIECDGAMYHSSKVARERDLYRQRFLEQQGWSIHRVWSRNWWKSKSGELEKIQLEVERLRGRLR